MTAVIRILDLETTGLEPPEHQPCEIGFCDLVAENTDLAGEPAWWTVTGGRGVLQHPGRSIPPEASAIHQIVDHDVAESDPWPSAAAMDILQPGFIEDDRKIIALAAHSAKFERLWLTDDLTGSKPWICTYKVALRLWPDAPIHSNQGLRHWHRPRGLNREVADIAHRAWPDAYVTAHLLRDMLNGEGATIEQLIQWSSEPALQVTCHIGKFRGMPWREVDEGFMLWILDRDFDDDVKFTCRTELERREREELEQQSAEVS